MTGGLSLCPDDHIPIMNLELSDEKAAALERELRRVEWIAPIGLNPSSRGARRDGPEGWSRLANRQSDCGGMTHR